MENAFSIHHSRLRHRADPSPDATCAAGSGVWGLEPVSIIINHISIYLFVNLTLCQSINQSINQSTNNLSIHWFTYIYIYVHTYIYIYIAIWSILYLSYQALSPTFLGICIPRIGSVVYNPFTTHISSHRSGDIPYYIYYITGGISYLLSGARNPKSTHDTRSRRWRTSQPPLSSGIS